MSSFILINPDHPGNSYALFYLLAFLTGFALLMWEGYKRNFETIPWMMVIGTSFLFFMIGCRVISFSSQEWDHIFRFEPIPYATGRSVLGGILLSIPGIWVARRCLRFQRDMVDAFSYVLPTALLVQRFGCLLAGCCFGTTTQLPWAIQYNNGSLAFAEHAHGGLLSDAAKLALPVHPVQVYEALGCLMVIAVLMKLRKLLKAPGNFFFTSFGLYGVLRFFLEFVRASGGHVVGGDYFFRLTYVQWALIFILPILYWFVRRRENRFDEKMEVLSGFPTGFFRSAYYFLALCLFFLLVSRWMKPLEVISFNIVLIPILIILCRNLFSWITVPRFRLATLVLPICSLVLMSQTLPETSTSSRSNYSTVSVGAMTGYNSMVFGTEGCNGNANTYYHSYSAVAIGFASTLRQRNNGDLTLGLNLFNGHHDEEVSGAVPFSNNGSRFNSMTGFNPYGRLDRPDFGIGGGFTAGDFSKVIPVDMSAPTSTQTLSFYPTFNIRIGDLSQVFAEYRFSSGFPTSYPSLNHQVMFGFGTKKRNRPWRGGGIRIGTASYSSLMIAPSTAIGEHLILETCLAFGGGLFHDYDHVHGDMASISLHYRFNNDQKERKHD